MRSLFEFVRQVFSGLRFRLLLLVLLVCMPLVVLMLHTAGEDRRRAVAGWRQRSNKMAQLARREEQDLLGSTRQLLLAISESSPVRSMSPRRCKKWVDELFATHPRYANLGVLDTNGLVLASAQPLPAANKACERPFFRRAVESRAFTMGELAASQGTNSRPAITFAYPVLGRTGEVQAVVFADLDLKWFDRYSSEMAAQVPKGATWTEVTRDGSILARHPNPDAWVGEPFPTPSLLQTAFGKTGNLLDATNEHGIATFYAFATHASPLTGGQVATILEIPRQSLFAEADRLLQRNLTWLGFDAVLALVLGWIGSRWLVLRPVRALVESSARLRRGELSARTGLPYGRDELGQLTRSFDEMAQALEDREKERLRTSHKLQVLSHRLVEVQESERRHIARELHDEIGQSLTAAEMNLQAALQAPGAATVERRLEESIQAVERVLEQVHDLSLNLRPSMLDDLGLEPALRWYTQRQAALTGLQAEFRAEPLEGRLNPVIETECFRVAQEALTNVVRHARASAVSVQLERREGQLHLSVRDDGVGFDVAALRREAVEGASLGLLSMEERASLAGGGFELISAPGKGTEVRAWFPLQWHNQSSWEEIE